MDGHRRESPINPYEVLGVPVDASGEEIEAAYRREARRWHPDVNRTPDAEIRMRRLNRAREALCRPHPMGETHNPPSHPPRPVVDPAAVDFGPVRAICDHAPTTVRLRNTGGPATSVRVEPEEGVFWSIHEVRGGEAEGDIAELDIQVRTANLAPGPHRDVVRLFLDENHVELKLTMVVQREEHPAVTLWTSAAAGLAGGTTFVLWGGASEQTLALGVLLALAVFMAGAVAGHRRNWPKNWSAWSPATVWWNGGVALPFHHHLSWPADVLPAGRRWTSARVGHYAQTAGVGLVRAVFSARQFEVYAGYRPTLPTRHRGPSESYVYIPRTSRFHKGVTERRVAHQVGHLAWPPFRHDADFFLRVQALVDAGACRACWEGLSRKVDSYP